MYILSLYLKPSHSVYCTFCCGKNASVGQGEDKENGGSSGEEEDYDVLHDAQELVYEPK